MKLFSFEQAKTALLVPGAPLQEDRECCLQILGWQTHRSQKYRHPVPHRLALPIAFSGVGPSVSWKFVEAKQPTVLPRIYGQQLVWL